jgi:hypothetical protein
VAVKSPQQMAQDKPHWAISLAHFLVINELNFIGEHNVILILPVACSQTNIM